MRLASWCVIRRAIRKVLGSGQHRRKYAAEVLNGGVQWVAWGGERRGAARSGATKRICELVRCPGGFIGRGNSGDSAEMGEELGDAHDALAAGRRDVDPRTAVVVERRPEKETTEPFWAPGFAPFVVLVGDHPTARRRERVRIVVVAAVEVRIRGEAGIAQ